jgi:WD40 repeat protein
MIPIRLASSPLKTLEGHQKGVLSVAWCKDDSDLLLSCGKDNRILVWNPNSAQVPVLVIMNRQCELSVSLEAKFKKISVLMIRRVIEMLLSHSKNV